MVKTFKYGYAAALLVILTSVPVRADVVYSNFAPGFTDSGNAVSVAGNNNGGEYYFVSFEPTNTVTFTDAITDLLWFTGENTLSAFLLSDNSGMPGSQLVTLDQTTPVANGLETFTCSSNCPTLAAGSVYWLELQETDPDTSIGWYLSSIDQSTGSDYALRFTYYGVNSPTYWPSGPRNVFEIDGTPDPDPVDEPGSAMMLLIGLGALASFTIWRRGPQYRGK